MAKKAKTVFVCQECGYESTQWMGKCICGAWNSFIEEKILPIDESDSRQRSSNPAGNARAARLSEVGSLEYDRIDTRSGELNRVLGGGLVKGSLVLISGEPGIGKSTIIIQTAARIAAQGKTVLYVSGEESEEQIKMRADRVCESLPEGLFVMSETNMENTEKVFDEIKPDFLIIDSIQTLYSNQLDSAPGSVSQVRMCGNQLMKLGKSRGCAIFIVAHVTKSGDLAGPKTVEHLVDCVLNFSGERDGELRILRAYKNRFGTTSEIGAFRMESGGLTEVSDVSATFLENKEELLEGSVASAIYEGSRPLMFEVQSLVTPANVGFARRTSVGIDNTRLNMILAVLEKKAGISLTDRDVYVNVVGGMRPEGTGADLAAALAIFSSHKRITCKRRTLAVGEIGLTGDLRSVRNIEKTAKEAARLGYEQIIMPLGNAKKIGTQVDGCRIVGVRNIQEAIKAFSV